MQGYFNQPEITESLRARLVDWVLHCTQVCEMEDKNIFFLVTEAIDTFYRLQSSPQPKAELQLTAIAAIFIASKLLQVNHVNLAFCHSNIGHGKFSASQITDRETEMIDQVGWEIASPLTSFQVFELLFAMLRRRLHGCPRLDPRALEEAGGLGLHLARAAVCSL